MARREDLKLAMEIASHVSKKLDGADKSEASAKDVSALLLDVLVTDHMDRFDEPPVVPGFRIVRDVETASEETSKT